MTTKRRGPKHIPIDVPVPEKWAQFAFEYKMGYGDGYRYKAYAPGPKMGGIFVWKREDAYSAGRRAGRTAKRRAKGMAKGYTPIERLTATQRETLQELANGGRLSGPVMRVAGWSWALHNRNRNFVATVRGSTVAALQRAGWLTEDGKLIDHRKHSL